MRDMSRRDFVQGGAAGLLSVLHHPPLHQTPAGAPSRTPGHDLCFMPATELAAAIRAKKVSPVEVVSAVYARLHEINPASTPSALSRRSRRGRRPGKRRPR